MDRNQFPRRMCRMALCLLAIEFGVWWGSRSQQVPPFDIPMDKPRPHSPPALDTAVPSRIPGNLTLPENPANGPLSFAID